MLFPEIPKNISDFNEHIIWVYTIDVIYVRFCVHVFRQRKKKKT